MTEPGRRVPGRWLRSSAIIALAVGATVSTSAVAAAAVSPAAAATRFVVTMFSDRGDYIGAGIPQEFDQTNATISGLLSPAGISLSLSGGTSGTDWSMDIDPAQGSTFKVGYYRGAQRAAFRTSGHRARPASSWPRDPFRGRPPRTARRPPLLLSTSGTRPPSLCRSDPSR